MVGFIIKWDSRLTQCVINNQTEPHPFGPLPFQRQERPVSLCHAFGLAESFIGISSNWEEECPPIRKRLWLTLTGS